VPLLGDELGLEAERVPELGLVGIPIPTAPPRLRHLLAAGSVPVVAPLAKGPLNVNADDAAAALAIALAADRLVFVSDVEGVQVGGATVATLDEAAAEAHRDDLNGGILPKLQAAFEAARAGIDVRIGRTQVTC
jgi:acetylglutamate kinase